MRTFEPVIGLEIHVQLNTKTKLFSPARNRFGDEPNTNITEVCTGQPGALPVLNKEAVAKAVTFGCAIEAEICLFSAFDRKSYFYPDSPRNFQITQYEYPLIKGGKVSLELEGEIKTFRIHHAHLEDDTGMLKHFTHFAGVDDNRAGSTLLEIVSEPCFHSAKEASSYAMAVKAIMNYLDASDCNMEEGSLRIDANVSVRPKGETTLRPKVEIKNMNSFSNMEMALDAEIARQTHLYTQHPHLPFEEVIQPGTYRFDAESKKTVLMRRKETAEDYRYFPEPDLPALLLTPDYIEKIRASLPELPHQRLKRYLTELQLHKESAYTLVNDKALSDYFEEAHTLCTSSKSLANWILVEFGGRLKEQALSLPQSGIPAAHIARLVSFIEEGKITGKIAKSIADEMVLHPGKDPAQIIQENPDFTPLNDPALIEAMVDEVLKENAQSIADYRAGKERAFGFLVGQVMKKAKGKADPTLINSLLLKKLS